VTGRIEAASESGLRFQHLLSAYAAGAVAGLFGGVVPLFLMMIPVALLGSGVIPAELDERRAISAAPLAGVIGGLLYISVVAWLPRPRLWRSVAYAAIGSVVIGGLLAGAYREDHLSDAEAVLIVAWAAAAGAVTPAALRGILGVLVHTGASMASLPVVHALFVAGYAFLMVVRDLEPMRRLLGGPSVIAAGVIGVCIVGLGVVAWTAGLQLPENRPRWFRAYGWAITAAAAVAGIVLLVAA
jgi:hypothetical protein